MATLEFACRFAYPTGFSLDFSFAAHAGVTALVGPSGSGKTTILNLVAGLLTPSSGHVRLGSKTLVDTAGQVNLPPEERGVGYVFQDYQLFPHLSVRENLRYGRRRTGDNVIPLDEVVNILRLRDLLKRYPVTLSGGQKQRVALGRALLSSPRLLLLDEPFSAVDEQLRAEVARYVAETVARFDLPTLVVSHDSASVASLASTIVALSE